MTVTDTTTNQYWSGSSSAGPEDLQSVTVTVDSISLIPDQTTQTTGDNTATYNYKIGQTLTRNDFTITTTPAGYGDYIIPGTSTYLVAFSMSPNSKLQLGDNVATASCGSSDTSQNLTGVQCSATWGAASAVNDGSYGASGNIDVGFSAEVQGAGGNYSVAGSGIVGTAPSGSLAEGVPTAGSLEVNPGSVDAGFNDTLTVSPSTGSSSASLPAAQDTAQLGAGHSFAGLAVPIILGVNA